MKHRTLIAALLAAILLLCTACGAAPQNTAAEPENNAVEVELGETEMVIEDLGPLLDDLVPLADKPPMSLMLETTAPGTAVKENDSARIDYSNIKDGYIMAEWRAGGTAKIKLVVKGPSGVSYQYNLKQSGGMEAFPLSDGNGSYTVTVYQNVSGSKYAVILSLTTDVKLTDEFAPFLRPNQYVSFSKGGGVEKKATEVCANATSTLDKVQRIYVYVTDNVSYDYDKAKSISTGYLPNVEETLSSKKGICFDFAALMAAMLRSQQIPTKLVVGYTLGAYHAWINVYVEETGWIEQTIYFNGQSWKLMDPTFASAGRTNQSVVNHVTNEANYSEKYLY